MNIGGILANGGGGVKEKDGICGKVLGFLMSMPYNRINFICR